jgi:spore coat polysaccharide biosynthesis protein SpsF
MEKIGIILQARMESTRLPGKIMKKIGNKSLLEHIFFRLLFLKHRFDVILATSNLPSDDEVERFCSERQIHCFRGSSENVLERYFFCAKAYDFEHIIRLTGDNPFVDIEELDNLIDLYLQAKVDFAHSIVSLPLGAGAEIFKFTALEKSFREGKKPHHLEHVDEYMLENPAIFRTAVLKVIASKNRPEIRLTIDTEDDYRSACFIVENAGKDFITTQEAIALAEKFLNKNLK